MSQANPNAISKFDRQKQRLLSAQFVFSLDPKTQLPIELFAPAINKDASTVRSDVKRRPWSLPKLTRTKTGRIFVTVEDLLTFLNSDSAEASVEAVPPGKRRVGRPTKAEQIARATAAAQNHLSA